MLDDKTFYSISNWLDLEGRWLPVIISGLKPACWHCSAIGHISVVCPKKMVPKKPDPARDTLPPTMAIDEKEAPVVLPTVRASDPESAAYKPPLPLRLLTTTTDESRVG